jgi:hypothetical protein
MRSLLLGLLGTILVGSLVAMLVTAASTYRRFRSSPGTFRCTLRAPLDLVGRLPTDWRHGPAHARWVHDVLLVRRGLLGQRVMAMPVRIPDDVIRPAVKGEVRGLGPEPLVLGLKLDGGELVEVAAPVEARTRLVGPFLAAAIPGLPAAAAEPQTPAE